MSIHKFIVMGATSGVGESFIAQALAADGANEVLALTRRLTPVFTALAKKTNRLSESAAFDPLDRDSLVAMRAAVASFAGDAPYAVVMPIGYFNAHKLGIHETLDENRKILEINYLAPAQIMQALIPHMLTHGGGHFVAYSCQSVRHHYPLMGAFTAAKSALESLIQTNANEYGGADKKVIFNALRLGSVKTDLTVRLKPAGDIDNYVPTEEVAGATLDLIRSPYSGLHNGMIIDNFRYSKTFFLDGPLTRIAHPENKGDIRAWKNDRIGKAGYPAL